MWEALYMGKWQKIEAFIGLGLVLEKTKVSRENTSLVNTYCA